MIHIEPYIVRQALDSMVSYGIPLTQSAKDFNVCIKALRREVAKMQRFTVRACNPNNTTTDEEVLKIHRLRDEGYSIKDIAYVTGVSSVKTSKILNGEVLLHVDRVCENKVIKNGWWKPGVAPAVIDYFKDVTGWPRNRCKTAAMSFCEYKQMRAIKAIDPTNEEAVLEFLIGFEYKRKPRVAKNEVRESLPSPCECEVV